MDGPKSVTASFTQDQYTLGINVSPSGVALVSKSPDTVTYVYGDVVTLTAAPNPGYTFSGWSGDVSGTASSVTVTMNGNKTGTATFAYALNLVLKAGYNLVSFPTVAGQVAITDLLSSISGQYTMVHVYEGCEAADPWKIYDPTLPPYANDLQYVDSTMAFGSRSNRMWSLAVKDYSLRR